MKLWAWSAFVVPLAVYVASISPLVAAWDTAELQTVPYILGIAHPTGFPVYVLLGWLFTHVFAVGTVAWRMGLMSALCMAGTALVLYVLARRLEVPPPGAFGASVLFAVGQVAWTRGTRAEVHSLATLEAVAATTAALAWYQEKNPCCLVATAALLGLGLATHETVGLIVPGVLVLIAAARRIPSRRTLGLCALVLVAPLVAYAYVPLRSAYVSAHRIDPTLSLGIPPGRPYWDYGNPAALPAFITYVTGSDFRAAEAAASLLSPATYLSIAPRLWEAFDDEFPVVALLLAAVGVIAVGRRDPIVPIGLGIALFAGAIFAYAFGAESDQARYALPAFGFVAVFTACGACALATLLAAGDRRSRDFTLLVAMVVLASRELWLQRDVFNQRRDTRFSDYVDRVRRVTPNNAIVIAEWAYATPLAYAAFVERSLGQRIVETAHPDDDRRRIAGWARTRPVYVVSPETLLIPGLDLTMASPGFPNLWRARPRSKR